MVMVALLATQCKKQTEPVSGQPEGETIEVTVRVENNTAKTDITADGAVSWKKGDRLYVVDETQGLLGHVSAVANGKSVYFDGSISAPTVGGVLRFYYVGDKYFTLDDSGNYTFNLGSQDGTLEGIAAHSQLMFGKSEQIAVGTTDLGTITMTSQMAIAHLNITNNSSNTVTVKGGFATSTFNAKTYDDDDAPLTGAAGTITMTSASAIGECYLALLPGAQTLTFASNNGAASLSAKTVEANTFYNSESAIVVTMTLPEGALPGLFTVSNNGTSDATDDIKVYFSKGNLQYLGSSDGTGTWRFAENQWDYMGNGPSGSKPGNVDLSLLGYSAYNTGSDKAAYDLFGWGCTGYQDTRMNNHTNWYQTNYQPYSTSTSTVNETYNKQGYGPDYYSGSKYNLTVENKSDWGCLAIGSDPAGTWRTLSSAEWAYLFNTRKFNGHTGEGYSYRRAWINSDASDGSRVYGMLLYPDGYTAQTTATSYTTEQWSAMESAGVVFLPAAGRRAAATTFYDVGSYGGYWSSSCYSSAEAHNMSFYSGAVGSQPHNVRSYAFSVRLVSEN